MLILYTILWHLVLPLVLLRLLWRSLKAPAYRDRWRERFGRFPAPELAGRESLWLHAVSVGEVRACQPLVDRLLRDRPGLAITITTTTPTGSAQVKRQFGDQVFHVYLPFDLPWAISSFLRRVRPSRVILMETEIWPNLLSGCSRRGVQVVLANARLSARSARGYARLGRVTRRILADIDLVAAQAHPDAQRFRTLGVAKERIAITGSLKFDMQLPASVAEQAQVQRRMWNDRHTWIAASTHEGEEELILVAHRRIRERFPHCLLVLVPRHPERFERVAELCGKAGFRVTKRSQGQVPSADTDVYLGDTMGELGMLIGSVDIAFFGGSLVPVGGHNMLEASAQGVPVLTGPDVFNFQSVFRTLVTEHAAEQVEDIDRLVERICHWLDNPEWRGAIGERGRRVVAANRGALDRLMRALRELDEQDPGQ